MGCPTKITLLNRSLGLITPRNGVISPFVTGRGPPLWEFHEGGGLEKKEGFMTTIAISCGKCHLFWRSRVLDCYRFVFSKKPRTPAVVSPKTQTSERDNVEVPASEAKNSGRVVNIRISGTTAGLKPCPKIALHRSKVDRYHDIVAYSMVGWMRNRNRNNSPWNVKNTANRTECRSLQIRVPFLIRKSALAVSALHWFDGGATCCLKIHMIAESAERQYPFR